MVVAIHRVEALLPPGAILVMGMVAAGQGVYADVMDFLEQRILEFPFLHPEGIGDLSDAEIGDLEVLLGKDLKVTEAKPAEGIQEDVPPLLGEKLDGEVPVLDSVRQREIFVAVFGVANQDPLRDGAIEVHVEMADGLFAEIQKVMALADAGPFIGGARKEEATLIDPELPLSFSAE